VDVAHTHVGGFSQRIQPSRIFVLSPLHQPQAFPKDLTGVLVASAVHQFADQGILVVGQYDISRGHDGFPI
jgi:hypothetical protein